MDGDNGMSAAAPDERQAPGGTLERLRRLHHPRCFVARAEEDFGLGVHFAGRPDSGVEAGVACPASWEGHPGLVHGGIIAALLDGAMTNALFARGTVAVTAELKIRYRHPLPLHRPATVVGLVTRCDPPLYVAEARIESEDTVYATGAAKFMRIPEGARRQAP